MKVTHHPCLLKFIRIFHELALRKSSMSQNRLWTFFTKKPEFLDVSELCPYHKIETTREQ